MRIDKHRKANHIGCIPIACGGWWAPARAYRRGRPDSYRGITYHNSGMEATVSIEKPIIFDYSFIILPSTAIN